MKLKDAKASEHPDPAICADVILDLVKRTSCALNRQLKSWERAFVEQGGLRNSTNCAHLTPSVSASEKSLTSQPNETHR